MDPFIEACGLWEGFHHHVIEHISAALADQVPENYFVDTGTRNYVVLVEEEGKKPSVFKPDVDVSTRTSRRRANGAAAVLDESAVGEDTYTVRALISEEFRESFIEIYAAEPERRLVTCIEMLSPSNKRKGTAGWDEYLRKRNGLLLGEANLVEIDLLRGGQRMPTVDPLPSSPYYILVARRPKAPYCRVQTAHYRRPLPKLVVPLESPDPDLSVDLQSIVDAIYKRYRYRPRIDYAKPLKPRLPKEDAAWLRRTTRESVRS
ncbi:MAG: DUF4058 family protein [Gemmataceae bacterium]|nr:DUF4058 family protein [Gemmataceae bacterium]